MKNLARLFALALIVVMTLSLVACGGPSSKIQGEWEAEFMGQKITWEFDGDKVINDGEEDDAAEFEIDDEVITIISEDGEETELEYEFEDDDTLIIDMEGIKLEFERQ